MKEGGFVDPLAVDIDRVVEVSEVALRACIKPRRGLPEQDGHRESSGSAHPNHSHLQDGSDVGELGRDPLVFFGLGIEDDGPHVVLLVVDELESRQQSLGLVALEQRNQVPDLVYRDRAVRQKVHDRDPRPVKALQDVDHPGQNRVTPPIVLEVALLRRQHALVDVEPTLVYLGDGDPSAS